MDEEEKARKALQSILDDEDADEKSKARARKALAAMDDDEDDKGEDEGDKDEARGKGSAPVALAPVDVEALIEAKLRERDERAERAQLLASRPDLDAATKDLLASAPIEKVRKAVKELPRRALNPAAAAQVTGTVGEGQGDGKVAILPPELDAQVDLIMGISEPERGVYRDGDRIVIGGVMPPKKG